MENVQEQFVGHRGVVACGGRGVGAQAVEVAFLYEGGELVGGRGVWIHVALFYGE